MSRLGRLNLTVIAICFAIVAFLAFSLLPRPGSRRTGLRTETLNNARQMVLGCLYYESAHGVFPADICDADGKPLLSWRVAILPYTEGPQELHEQFHLDEPWNSDHNLALLDQMPPYHRSANVRLAPGMCNLMGVSGEGTMFGSKPVKLRDIQDGVTSTVLIVEVDPDRAVPWTQPADWEFDPAFPSRELGNGRQGGFVAGFVDGSMRFIRTPIDAKTWKALVTIAGSDPAGDY